MSEQLDIVSATGEYLRTADRSEVHDGGHWHQVFHCIVVRSEIPGQMILQRRHRSKAAFPGLLDLSATGHLEAGESPTDGVRELNEELGTDATVDDLHFAGERLLADDDGEGRNRERVHLFFTTDDRPVDEFNPDPDEVQSLVEVEIGGLLDLIADERAADVRPDGAKPRTMAAVEWTPGSAPVMVRLAAAELIKPADGYWTVALVMAERFVRGQQPYAI